MASPVEPEPEFVGRSLWYKVFVGALGLAACALMVCGILLRMRGDFSVVANAAYGVGLILLVVAAWASAGPGMSSPARAMKKVAALRRYRQKSQPPSDKGFP